MEGTGLFKQVEKPALCRTTVAAAWPQPRVPLATLSLSAQERKPCALTSILHNKHYTMKHNILHSIVESILHCICIMPTLLLL